jgi:hypothetical protein
LQVVVSARAGDLWAVGGVALQDYSNHTDHGYLLFYERTPA